jgi:toxin-antitoxin system PIN domain toxin
LTDVNLCDSNVWLALALSGHVHQRVAREWFERITEPGAVLFCRATQQTFLRLLTNASVLAPYGNRPLTNSEAWSAYETILGDDRVVLRSDEPPGLDPRWRALAARQTAAPKLWMDAYLAAFAMAAGYRLVTTDADFRQFPGLNHVLLR